MSLLFIVSVGCDYAPDRETEGERACYIRVRFTNYVCTSQYPRARTLRFEKYDFPILVSVAKITITTRYILFYKKINTVFHFRSRLVQYLIRFSRHDTISNHVIKRLYSIVFCRPHRVLHHVDKCASNCH